MVRTCVACRKACEVDTDLIRVVLRGSVLTPVDSSQGRGAWVHIACATQALKSQKFRAAFKSGETFDGRELTKFLNEMDAKDMKQK